MPPLSIFNLDEACSRSKILLQIANLSHHTVSCNNCLSFHLHKRYPLHKTNRNWESKATADEGGQEESPLRLNQRSHIVESALLSFYCHFCLHGARNALALLHSKLVHYHHHLVGNWLKKRATTDSIPSLYNTTRNSSPEHGMFNEEHQGMTLC
jgi:hypothetical protein